jgi:hypothetical protein
MSVLLRIKIVLGVPVGQCFPTFRRNGFIIKLRRKIRSFYPMSLLKHPATQRYVPEYPNPAPIMIKLKTSLKT